MADRKEIEAALMAADQAGDQEAVQVLMGELNKMDNYQAPPPPSSLAQFGRSLLNASARPIINAATGLPNLAQDLGVSARNYADRAANAVAPGLTKKVYDVNKRLIEASGNNSVLDAVLPTEPRGDHELPSQGYQRAIDATFAPPETTGGKLAELVSSGLAGARLPAPTSLSGGSAVPAGVTSAREAEQAHKMAILARAQARGAVVPPATVNPTLTNRTLESIGGKHATAQQASLDNATNFTAPLAREAVDAPANSILDRTTLDIMRKHANQGYEAVRKIGKIIPPMSYHTELASINQQARNAAKAFPELAKGNEMRAIEKAVNSVQRAGFDSSEAIDAIAHFRQLGTTAYSNGQHMLGAAYKKIATALENGIESSLVNNKTNKTLLDGFRASRAQLAKLHALEDATNPVTGETSAKLLGDQLKEGRPLTGALREIGEFGAAYPKEGRTLAESVGVNQLTANMGMLAGANSQNSVQNTAIGMGLPLVGQSFRSFMLSPLGQRLLTGPPGVLGQTVKKPMALPGVMYQGHELLGGQ